MGSVVGLSEKERSFGLILESICEIAFLKMTKSKDNPEKSRELISEENMKDLLTKQLEIVGSGGAFVW